ncbi:YmfQ family protein [Mixta calida]|uniref:YmfQ family protein n=1 Tax=Mixta calida TaxID=665913 RepID=UPI00290F85C7|nr:YmfQ family protein [Mixta calida]MDU4291139.1 YmfQ family protein [Mixta calida]
MSKFSQEDYCSALQALMPDGPVWPREPTSVQATVLNAQATEYQQSDTDALALLRGAFPATATIMLKEWETSLGLPDDCAIGETDSIALRQKAVVTKLTATGGQSIAYFTAQAKALGYNVQIAQFRQARAGMSAAGAALNGDDWPFVMLVTAPQTTITYAQAGVNYAGDPLRSWGNKLLECRLTRLAPSHIVIIFAYTANPV